MRVPRFYVPQSFAVGQEFTLPNTTFRHAVQVLRLGVGEQLILFNGEGGEYFAQISNVSKRSASVQIDSFSAIDTESPAHLTLVQAVIKPDKMDFSLQKAVELGVNTIQPLITQRSVVRIGKEQVDKKLQHWEGIVVAACEQSGRTRMPNVQAPLTLERWLETPFVGTRIILAPGDFPRINALSADLPTPIALLIGPEGGFTDEEVETCVQAGVMPVSLGPRILRAETASSAALALLQHRFGDL
ncbi:16S rRNA (uracil(1498)-N(3))-methyltransferase [Thiothrix unzii]|jgi:16S rRNA (uracil1498-N3)-methyltransferase|uniref:16S rRNA (uracil(1498)-N(3))-methyltransferase n=1 Tax=Thiothrix unzii TaxID=111769 RepID=UPI002A35891D|nr:16S rRNA (uracil(1498)-N(3))-methyltransferase [Thiothrix unzii]MDX9987692.1 16S rRNA (uracil(1498)-N(3))-methyltransferase [Thiothrix unzii]